MLTVNLHIDHIFSGHIQGAFSRKCPRFCKCLKFLKYGFPNLRIFLATKKDQHFQKLTDGV